MSKTSRGVRISDGLWAATCIIGFVVACFTIVFLLLYAALPFIVTLEFDV